jgi:hypothetical protein
MDYIVTAILSALAGGLGTWYMRTRIQSVIDWFQKIGPLV